MNKVTSNKIIEEIKNCYISAWLFISHTPTFSVIPVWRSELSTHYIKPSSPYPFNIYHIRILLQISVVLLIIISFASYSMDVFRPIPQFVLCLMLTVDVVHRPAEVSTGRPIYKVYRTLAVIFEYLYSTPAKPVYTMAGRAHRPLGRTVQNIII